jgi:LysR family glycine cleavage system transcriptional activator
MVEATAALRPEEFQLTISVAPTFAAKWLLPRLTSFTEVHPDIELRVLAAEGLANFESDGVDIAVRQGKPPFGPGLVVDLLFEQELVAVCSPALLDDLPQPLRPETISGRVLLNDAHDLWPEFIEQALQLPQPSAAKRVRFNQTALAIDAAIAGQGIALASRFLVSQDIAAGRLVQAVAPTMRGAQSSYVVSPRKPRNAKPTARVRDWLLQLRD